MKRKKPAAIAALILVVIDILLSNFPSATFLQIVILSLQIGWVLLIYEGSNSPMGCQQNNTFYRCDSCDHPQREDCYIYRRNHP